MKAIRVTGCGGFEKFETANVPVPNLAPKTGEVLIKIHACGINNSDINMWEGPYGMDSNTKELAGWWREGISFSKVPGSLARISLVKLLN